MANKKNLVNGKPTLWQSVHVLHKKGRYYIVHFKSLFLLDGKDSKTDYTEEDKERTKLIARLLNDWGLVKLKTKIEGEINSDVMIIPFSDKNKWNLKSKYTIGHKKDQITNE